MGLRLSPSLSLSFAILLIAQLLAEDYINFPNYVAYWAALIAVELHLILNRTIGAHVAAFYVAAAIDSVTTHIVFFTENSGCSVAASPGAQVSLFKIVSLKVLASANLISTGTLLSGYFQKLRGGIDTPFFSFDTSAFFRADPDEVQRY